MDRQSEEFRATTSSMVKDLDLIVWMMGFLIVLQSLNLILTVAILLKLSS